MDRTVSIISQEKLFKAILSLPENKYCADCRSLNPDWVSMNLGVFVCYKCSGTHRSFGSHITRVISTTLDTWTLKQIYIMGTIDNVKANLYWEATIPKDFAKPNFDSTPADLATFARKKYVQKVFLALDTECPADEVRKNLEAAYRNEEEDKDEFFLNKLEELKVALRSKVSCLSPEGRKSSYRTPKFRTVKKATTLIIPESCFSDAIRSATPGKRKSNYLFSPLLPMNKRGISNPFANDSQVSSQNTISSSQFPLFKGLTLKTQTSTIIDEGLETSIDSRACRSKVLNKSNTAGVDTLRFSARSSHQPSTTTTSKNTFFELLSKPRLFNYPGEDIFEESRSPTLKGSIEMKDMSNTSLHQEAEDSLFDRKTSEDSSKDQTIKKSSRGSYDSYGLILSDVGHLEPHLKRPSEAFEIPKSINIQAIPSTRRGNERFWKYSVILGSFLLHLVIGYLYCWGGISPYIASFVMSDSVNDRYLEHASHNMMIFLGVAMGFCLCEKLANAIGMRVLVFGSFLGIGGTILLCSMTHDVILYSALLTIVPGFFIGLVYDVPYHCASQYFALQQIFLKGFFYLTNGIGAAAYIFFSYYYLSLTNSGAELNAATPREVRTSSFYSDKLANHIPDLLKDMSYIILAIGLIGTILIQPKGSFIIRDWSGIRERAESLLMPNKARPKRKATTTLRQGLKEALISPNTKTLFFLVIWSFVLSSFLLYSYKSYGLQLGYSDQFMTIVGGFGMILLGVGKLVGVVIHQRKEFRAMCKKIIKLQAFAGLALFFLSQTVNMAFLPIFLMIMFLDGVLFSLVIEEIKFVYLEDVEDSMIALMIVGYAVANFLSFMIVKSLLVLHLEFAVMLVLTLPLFLAFKVSKGYSRATAGNDAEMISILLAD